MGHGEGRGDTRVCNGRVAHLYEAAKTSEENVGETFGGGGEMMGENEREMGENGIHLLWLVGAKIGDLIKRKGTRNK